MATNQPESTKYSDSRLEERINASLKEGKLPCPVAFKVANELNIVPIIVGTKADSMSIKIGDCQLGCFGKSKLSREELAGLETVPAVVEAIQTSLVNGAVPCKTAHDLSKTLKVSRKRFGDTASKLNVKISDCQLGCF